jgi:hypothetical protein
VSGEGAQQLLVGEDVDDGGLHPQGDLAARERLARERLANVELAVGQPDSPPMT